MSRELSFSTRLTSLLATMLLLGCGLVVGLNYLKFERILLDQQARVLEIIAEELGRTVENSLALGVQLAGVPGAQSLLERELATSTFQVLHQRRVKVILRELNQVLLGDFQ